MKFLLTGIFVFLSVFHFKQGNSQTSCHYLNFFFEKNIFIWNQVNGLQCYQCDSSEDPFCPAYGFFDETKNAMVDCYGLESATPGHMCVKISKSSPDTLYGWRLVYFNTILLRI